jgi:peptide/nickel transport system ATP-binding protein
MYLGKIMEQAPVKALFAPPYHPYTEALLSAVPVPDPTVEQKRIRLAGELPSPLNVPQGCRFASRCPRKVGAICDRQPPPARQAGDGHVIHCHIPLDELSRLAPIFGPRSPDKETGTSAIA